MTNPFQKATKVQQKARVALYGPSGSGKTFTALRIGSTLGERVAVVDTEHGSSALYADRFSFDMLEMTSFDPRNYIRAIEAAQGAGYDVLIIDSLSHAWTGKDGALELVERAKGKYGGNQWSAWADVTPLHQNLIEAMLAADLHLIATMRSKTAWEVQQNSKGKVQPVKVGLAPIQRDGMEYEFTVTAQLDVDHNMHIDKTRCHLLDGKSFQEPGEDVAEILLAWLNGGEPAPEKPQPKPATKPEQPTGNGAVAQPGQADDIFTELISSDGEVITVKTDQWPGVVSALAKVDGAAEVYGDADGDISVQRIADMLIDHGKKGTISDKNVDGALEWLINQVPEVETDAA